MPTADDVAFDALHALLPGEEALVAEIHRVVDADLVAELLELRHQQAADVAGAAGDEHVVELAAHAAARGAMA